MFRIGPLFVTVCFIPSLFYHLESSHHKREKKKIILPSNFIIVPCYYICSVPCISHILRGLVCNDVSGKSNGRGEDVSKVRVSFLPLFYILTEHIEQYGPKCCSFMSHSSNSYCLEIAPSPRWVAFHLSFLSSQTERHPSGAISTSPGLGPSPPCFRGNGMTQGPLPGAKQHPPTPRPPSQTVMSSPTPPMGSRMH